MEKNIEENAEEKLKDKVKISMLCEYYGKLLTAKQYMFLRILTIIVLYIYFQKYHLILLIQFSHYIFYLNNILLYNQQHLIIFSRICQRRFVRISIVCFSIFSSNESYITFMLRLYYILVTCLYYI